MRLVFFDLDGTITRRDSLTPYVLGCALLCLIAPALASVLLLPALWSIRLALHIYQRALYGEEDSRYRYLRAHWSSHTQLKFFLFYQLQALTVIVFSFYFSAEAPRIRRVVGSWLPQRHQKVFLTVWDIAVVKTGGFVVSKVVLATMSAFFHSLFFYLIDIPYWLPMGIFAGVVSQFIPTIGTYIGVAIPAVFAAFNDPWDVVWIIAFATVYQQIESYVFTPRVSRATMDVHPAIALGSVFVGVALFGAIGAIIGIPMAAAIIAVIETYGQRYELVPELRARTKGEKSMVDDPLVDEHVELPAGTKLSQLEDQEILERERAAALSDAEDEG